MKYRRRPDIVEAIQYIGANKQEIRELTKNRMHTNTCYDYLTIWNSGHEDSQNVHVGDWVAIDEKGIIHVYNDDVFINKFEACE
jgi:hypothetical protein